MTALLTVKNLSIRLGAMTLVHDLTFSLQAGEVLTILGETGAGKSLLLKSLMGLLPAAMQQHGSIQLTDRELSTLSAKEREQLWGRQIALLPQEPLQALDPLMRAERQVSEVHECVNGNAAPLAQHQAQQQLTTVGLSDATTKYPFQLSGGMAQRVAFCATTAAGARVLLADEPTKGLDERNRDALVAALQAQTQHGCLVVVTHDVEVARQLPGQLLVMQAGKIVEVGPTKTVLQQPRTDYAQALITAGATSDTHAKSQASTPFHTSRAPAHPDHTAEQTPLFTLHQLSKARGKKSLFNDLTLQLPRGAMIGLCGESGSGKSSLGDLLLQLLAPDAGRIECHLPATTARHRFQKLYQDPPSAFAHHCALHVLFDDVLRLYQLPAQKLTDLLTRLKLDARLLQRRANEVSGGELQRLAIARALLLDPVFLVADEPTSRLDPLTAQEILALLNEVRQDFGCTVLLISHERAQLLHHCSLVYELMNRQLARIS
jgi:peptide/nickel transport system ATP-binding protein